MDSELDFELEESLLFSPCAINNNKRSKKNVIGLDDLVEEFKQNKDKEARKKEKRAKARKRDDRDDYERGKEAALFRVVDACHKQVSALSGEEENSSWGLELFENQKTRPNVSFPELGSSMLLQSCMKDEINNLLELNPENGKSFLEGLLVNGWLKKLVFIDGLLEDSVARWTFNLLLYSSREELRKSACDFWLDILASQKQGNMPISIEWYPCYSELKSALAIYGFVFNSSPDNETIHSGSEHCGPPQNIRCWIRILRSCCQIRNRRSFFSSSEAEELVAVIICLLLDRQLQGLSFLMHECLQSAMDYFTDYEWNSSCEKIAISLVSRVPMDLNCVKIVECIGGENIRAQQLRHAVSYKFLVSCFDDNATDEDILKRLVAINVKEKKCDLLKMFIYLVLVENWLLMNPILKDKPAVKDLWGVLLRNCSCQISSTDLRSYASKVRDRASFVLQGTVDKFVTTV